MVLQACCSKAFAFLFLALFGGALEFAVFVAFARFWKIAEPRVPPHINPYPWLSLAMQISSRAPKLSQRLAQGAGQRQQAQNRACWRKCCAISRHIVKQYPLLSDFPKSKESDKNGNFQPPPKSAKNRKATAFEQQACKTIGNPFKFLQGESEKKSLPKFHQKFLGKKGP